MDLLYADPPYNIWHETRNPGFFYVIFAKINIGDVLDLAEATRRPEGQNLVFCSTVQFSDWVNTQQKWMKTLPSTDDEAERVEQKKKLFWIWEEWFQLPAYENYSQHTSKRSVYHMNMAEHAISFWKSGSSSKEPIQREHYSNFPPHCGDYSLNTYLLLRIPHLSFNETVFDWHNPAGPSGMHRSLFTNSSCSTEVCPSGVSCDWSMLWNWSYIESMPTRTKASIMLRTRSRRSLRESDHGFVAEASQVSEICRISRKL